MSESGIRLWLEKHGLTYEASFVYPRWLEFGGELELVTGFVGSWLKRHGTTADASFLYEFWLRRGGGISSIRPHIQEWIKLHGHTMRYKNIQRVEWLRRVGDLLSNRKLDLARDRAVLEHFLRWVNSWEGWRKSQHQTISAIESLKRRFPCPGLWDLVHFHQQIHPRPQRERGFRTR